MLSKIHKKAAKWKPTESQNEPEASPKEAKYIFASWAVLGPSCAILGRLGAILGPLGAILGRLGAIVDTSWYLVGSGISCFLVLRRDYRLVVRRDLFCGMV